MTSKILLINIKSCVEVEDMSLREVDFQCLLAKDQYLVIEF